MGNDPDHPAGSAYVMGESDDVLYGVWDVKGPYYARFTDTDGILSELPEDTTAYFTGDEITLPSEDALVYDRDLYRFIGWAAEENGGPLTDEPMIVKHADLTFYARFEQVEEEPAEVSENEPETTGESAIGSLPFILTGGAVLLGAVAAVSVILLKKRKTRISGGRS